MAAVPRPGANGHAWPRLSMYRGEHGSARCACERTERQPGSDATNMNSRQLTLTASPAASQYEAPTGEHQQGGVRSHCLHRRATLSTELTPKRSEPIPESLGLRDYTRSQSRDRRDEPGRRQKISNSNTWSRDLPDVGGRASERPTCRSNGRDGKRRAFDRSDRALEHFVGVTIERPVFPRGVTDGRHRRNVSIDDGAYQVYLHQRAAPFVPRPRYVRRRPTRGRGSPSA